MKPVFFSMPMRMMIFFFFSFGSTVSSLTFENKKRKLIGIYIRKGVSKVRKGPR